MQPFLQNSFRRSLNLPLRNGNLRQCSKLESGRLHLRLQASTAWDHCDGPREYRRRQEIYWKRVEEVTHHTISSNLEGLVTPADRSPDNPATELNYLIFSELAFNPAANLDEVFRFKLSRLYGGEEAARRLAKILQLLEDATGMLAANYDEALRLAKQAAELSDRNGRPRWTRLIEYIQSLK